MKTFVLLFVATALSGKAWANGVENTTVDESSSEDVTIFSAPQYFKPVNPSAPRSPSTTTGTRTGGCFDADASPYLMAPTNFVGETATAMPTFTWFLPDDEPVPIEFNLYELQPSGASDLHHSGTLSYEPEISQYQLPAEAALEANQTYLWQMILHCNSNRPSQALVYEAEVEFVPSAVSAEPLGNVVEQSRALAETGYWYDAIAALGTSERPDIVQVRSTLLNDLKLLESAMGEGLLEE